MGHRAKFRDKKNVLCTFFSGSSDFTPFFTSGTLHARLLREISIHTADACILAMSCVGYAHARLKTLSSLLNWETYVLREKFATVKQMFLLDSETFPCFQDAKFASATSVSRATKPKHLRLQQCFRNNVS